MTGQQNQQESHRVVATEKCCSAAVHSTPCTSSSRGRTVADCASPSQCSQEPHTPLSTLELRSVRPPTPFLSYLALPSKIPDPPLATCIYRQYYGLVFSVAVAFYMGLPEHRRSPKHDRRLPVLDLSQHRRLPQITTDHRTLTLVLNLSLKP